jgi:hypothetical protein
MSKHKMDGRKRPRFASQLLNFLSAKNRAILALHLERVSLVPRETIEEPNQPIEHIYFPNDGIASVVGTSGCDGQKRVRFSSFIMERQAPGCLSGRGWTQRRQGGANSHVLSSRVRVVYGRSWPENS